MSANTARRSVASNAKSSSSSGSSSGGGSTSPAAAAAAQQSGVNTHMAERLERIILSLQTEMRETEAIATNETVLFALAELKHVRDVLSGRLAN